MTLRVLVVCTANVCRSPVAERLLARYLTAAGVDAEVRSAGTRGGRNTVDAESVLAARELDIDVTGHVSRPLTTELIETEGADLVVAMTREHLREVVALDPAAWSRSFTLKELARRAVSMPAAAGPKEWVAAAGAGRKAADMMAPSDEDDLADPYGGPAKGYRVMVTSVDSACRVVASASGWAGSGDLR